MASFQKNYTRVVNLKWKSCVGTIHSHFVTVHMDVYIRDMATPVFLTMMYYTRVVNNQYVYIEHHSCVPYIV